MLKEQQKLVLSKRLVRDPIWAYGRI